VRGGKHVRVVVGLREGIEESDKHNRLLYLFSFVFFVGCSVGVEGLCTYGQEDIPAQLECYKGFCLYGYVDVFWVEVLYGVYVCSCCKEVYIIEAIPS